MVKWSILYPVMGYDVSTLILESRGLYFKKTNTGYHILRIFYSIYYWIIVKRISNISSWLKAIVQE